MITASHSVSQRGAKRWRVEISKTGGGEVVDRGLDRFFRCCTQGSGFPGARVKDIWEDRAPGALGLCRETHGVEVVGVLAARCILTPDLWECQPRMFPALLSVSSTGPARGSVSEATTPLFSQICPFWEWERKRLNVRVNYLHLFVPTNNETVNLVLLQKHIYYYCWKRIKLYFLKT